MKKPNDDHIDKLFRDGMKAPEGPVGFKEADWDDMARLLDGKTQKRGGVIRLSLYISGIAALLLLAIGLFWMRDTPRPDSVQRKPSNSQSVAGNKRTDQHTIESGRPAQQPSTPSNVSTGKKDLGNAFAATPAVIIPEVFYQDPAPVFDSIQQLQQAALTDRADRSLTGNVVADTSLQMIALQPQPDSSVKKNVTTPQPKIKNNVSGGPVLAISVLGAPDVNSVSSWNNGQVGSTVALQLSLRLTSRLSITTGAAYGKKPYHSTFAQYSSNYTRPIQPTDVMADCRVLDVPLNINYQLYNKGSNRFAVGTGLSSYFMLSERYQFNYAANSGISPYNLNISGQNQHILGVLNLNATYERRLNSKFGIIAQPYLKLPLTGIGNGQVGLRSTGVAIGFNWNIDPFRKTK